MKPRRSTNKLASHPIVVLIAGLVWIFGIVYVTKSHSPSGTKVLGEQITRQTINSQLLDSRNFEIGKCYDWSSGLLKSKTYATAAIDCSEPHRFEMVSKQTVPDQKAFPSPEKWTQIREALCTKSITDYLGTPIDPQGKYYVDSVYPDEASWDSGQRDLSCGLGSIAVTYEENRQSVDGQTIGKAVGTNQQLLYGNGACLRRDQLGSGAVDCALLHNEEILSQIDVDGQQFTSDDAFQKRFANECKAQAKASLGRELRAHEFVGVLGKISSIKIGTQQFECYMTHVDAGNNELSWSGLLRLQD